jgi:hypothetical protein
MVIDNEDAGQRFLTVGAEKAGGGALEAKQIAAPPRFV